MQQSRLRQTVGAKNRSYIALTASCHIISANMEVGYSYGLSLYNGRRRHIVVGRPVSGWPAVNTYFA